jgi:hypothetical protein
MLTKAPSNFSIPQVESSQPSKMATYVEMAIALAACAGILVVAALVWYVTNSDLLSSIQRLQEMI